MSSRGIDELIEEAFAEPIDEGQDVAILTQAWISERAAPELLPYKQDLIERMNIKLRQQIEVVESGNVVDVRTNFVLIILQTEIERIKYLLRSYLRTRLSKLDKHAAYYIADIAASERLSFLERQYVQKHQAILERHYTTTFVKHFPQSGSLRKLNDTAVAGLSMIDEPDTKSAVFCQVLQSAISTVLADKEELELEKGNVVLLHYANIKKLLHDGSLVLI